MDRTMQPTSEPGIWKITSRGTRGGETVRYRVAYRVPGLGQRTKTFRKFTEAKAFRHTLGDPGQLRQLRELERGRITLGAYFPTWLEWKRRLAPSTRARYEFVGRKYIVPSRLSSMLISAISREDVERWIADLERQGVPAPTIDKTYRTLRACLETAVGEGKALANPARRIELPHPEDRETYFLTEGEVELIANAVPELHRALVYFLAFTGVRIGEASALRLKNLDLPVASSGSSSPPPRWAGTNYPQVKRRRANLAPSRWLRPSWPSSPRISSGTAPAVHLAISTPRASSSCPEGAGRYGRTTGEGGSFSPLVSGWGSFAKADAAAWSHPGFTTSATRRPASQPSPGTRSMR